MRDLEVALRKAEAERDAAVAQVREYESTISWGVTCTNCADLLSKLYEAEAQIEGLRYLTTGPGGPITVAEAEYFDGL